MSGYLLGIDNGGTLVKCALFDLRGGEAATSSARVPMDVPAPGFTERDTDEIWRANAAAIREVLAKAGVDGRQVLGVAVCGYGNGITLLDASGEPSYPTVVSTDARATGYVTGFAQGGIRDRVYAITQQDIWAAQPVVLLPWFRDNRPDVLAKTAHVQFVKDYVRYKLTGELCGEVTDASGTNLFDLVSRRYDPRLFALAGIDDLLPLFPSRVAGSTEMAGKVTRRAAAETGLAEGTPVAGGLFDIDACCASSGIMADDALCLVSGTWSINEYVTKRFEEGAGKYSTTLSYLPDHYLIAESSPTSASNFDWYIDNVFRFSGGEKSQAERFAHCDALAESIAPGDSDLVFVPYLYGSNSYPADRGAFFNMSSYYNGSHLLRAVYEGVVFSSCLHVERLARGRAPFARARLSGGVAKSPVWAQMLADALQVHLEIVQGSELGALGSAMCAGICSGVFRDFPEAAERMVRVGRSHSPNRANADAYAAKFARFKKAVRSVDMFHMPESAG